jgi:hypothetical protein
MGRKILKNKGEGFANRLGLDDAVAVPDEDRGRWVAVTVIQREPGGANLRSGLPAASGPFAQQQRLAVPGRGGC